jgi:murein DD-endopeptidase MepM/ murein hydrolase activator NlpD
MTHLELAQKALADLRSSSSYKRVKRGNGADFPKTPLGQCEAALVELVNDLAPPKPRMIQLPETFRATHQTDGLPGYPAIDVFAEGGTQVGAPCAGTVRRHSGHRPTAVATPGGPYGWSIYIEAPSGTDYFLTHFGTRTTKVGQRVEKGDVIGTVADYTKATRGVTPSHIHEGRRP